MHCRIVQPSAEFGDFAPYPTTNVPMNYPVKVDEDKMTVTVQGGVITRVLLDYLAIYT
jgi:FAD/FMN-containing dehydrogenase